MLLKYCFRVLLTIIFSLPCYAVTGPYMSASLGYARLQGPERLHTSDAIFHFDQDQNTPLLRLATGWLFLENLGLEIAYAHLFQRSYETEVANSQTNQDNLDLLAVWYIPLSTLFEVRLGAGGSYKQTDYDLDSFFLHEINTTRKGWVQTLTAGLDCYITRYIGVGLGYQWWGSQSNDVVSFKDTTYYLTGRSSSWLFTLSYRFL